MLPPSSKRARTGKVGIPSAFSYSARQPATLPRRAASEPNRLQDVRVHRGHRPRRRPAEKCGGRFAPVRCRAVPGSGGEADDGADRAFQDPRRPAQIRRRGRGFLPGADICRNVHPDQRGNEHQQAAHPYLVAPPTVAQAWSLAVSRSGAFLWPRHGNGKEIYDFYANTSPSRVAYSFTYQPSDAPEPELSEAELQVDASLAG